jgi:hypothetical protein
MRVTVETEALTSDGVALGASGAPPIPIACAPPHNALLASVGAARQISAERDYA